MVNLSPSWTCSASESDHVVAKNRSTCRIPQSWWRILTCRLSICRQCERGISRPLKQANDLLQSLNFTLSPSYTMITLYPFNSDPMPLYFQRYHAHIWWAAFRNAHHKSQQWPGDTVRYLYSMVHRHIYCIHCLFEVLLQVANVRWRSVLVQSMKQTVSKQHAWLLIIPWDVSQFIVMMPTWRTSIDALAHKSYGRRRLHARRQVSTWLFDTTSYLVLLITKQGVWNDLKPLQRCDCTNDTTCAASKYLCI